MKKEKFPSYLSIHLRPTFHCAASDDHIKYPIPTPENDWKNFHRPWPDDGYALGDYPNLPEICNQRRQHLGWWDVQERRNYNEPVSVLTLVQTIP